MSRPLRMGAAAAVVSGSVLLSRLLGLGREALLAGLIGVSAEADLYKQAFLIPDLLNYLLAGAYLTITLIPILSRHLEAGEADRADRAFTSVFRFVAGGIVGLTALMWALADPMVSLVFPGAADHSRLVDMTRLVLPAQVFLVVGALLMAVQYTHRRFLVPALAPLIYNLGIIAGGLLGAAGGDPTPEAFLWGAVIGSAVGNFGLQWLGARRSGTWFTRDLAGESYVGEYLMLALPLMIGQSVAVLDEQFVRFFGQVQTGTTAALDFARRLNMVPVGVIAQAAGVAAYPFLARLAAKGESDQLADTTGRAARNTVFIAAGASAAVVVLARPLVRLIYEYGEFTAQDGELVARLLAIYAVSIPAWGLHQILVRHFYAKRKMWTPVVIGTTFTVLAIPTWLGLYDLLGIEGFAWASSILITGYAAAMAVAWGRDSGWSWAKLLVPAAARATLAGIAAGLIAWPVTDAVFGAGSRTLLAGLGAATIGGVTVVAAFLTLSYLLRSPELADMASRRRA